MEKKVVIVTGGSRGIGRAIAERFNDDRHNVIIADVNEPVEHDQSCEFVKTDVSVVSSVSNLVKTIYEKYKRIDVLVNNAGICIDNSFEQLTLEQWHKVMDVNLNGCFYCCKEVTPIMKKLKKGKIINICSLSGHYVNPGQVNYGVSKAGVIALTKYLGVELAKYNIDVNGVSPGMVDTEMVRKIDPTILNKIIPYIPKKELGKIEEVAGLVHYLASDECRYINGQIIQITGGLKV